MESVSLSFSVRRWTKISFFPTGKNKTSRITRIRLLLTRVASPTIGVTVRSSSTRPRTRIHGACPTLTGVVS